MHSFCLQMAEWYPGAFGIPHKPVKREYESCLHLCFAFWAATGSRPPFYIFNSRFQSWWLGCLWQRTKHLRGCLVERKNKRLGCFLFWMAVWSVPGLNASPCMSCFRVIWSWLCVVPKAKTLAWYSRVIQVYKVLSALCRVVTFRMYPIPIFYCIN